MRSADRITVSLVCSLSKDHSTYSAIVANINESGLLTCWKTEEFGYANPQVGESWKLEIEVPVYSGLAPKCMICQGRVVRVVVQDEPQVAFRISQIELAELNRRTSQLKIIRS